MWSDKPENLTKLQVIEAVGHTVVRYAVDTMERVGKVACCCGAVVEAGWVAHETYLALLQEAWRTGISHAAASR